MEKLWSGDIQVGVYLVSCPLLDNNLRAQSGNLDSGDQPASGNTISLVLKLKGVQSYSQTYEKLRGSV
jgi:hypothetical protein